MSHHRIHSLENLENRRLLAIVTGTIFNDLNQNGSQDVDEPGLADVRAFIDVNLNNRFDEGEPNDFTNVDGIYAMGGIPTGNYYVMHEFEPGFAQLTPGPVGAKRNAFDIDLLFLSPFDAEYRQLFELAAARWENVIVGDLEDQLGTVYGSIDDILILADLRELDGESGILAEARPLELRGALGLPWLGEMTFDSADAAVELANGSLLDTITHEMGHALGFGGLWRELGLADFSNPFDPRYIGVSGVEQYRIVAGDGTATSVPLENIGVPGDGSYGSHWRTSELSPELMVAFSPRDDLGNPVIPTPLSRLTVGAMEDLGYEVDIAAAEEFTINQGSMLPRPEIIPSLANLRPYSVLVTISDVNAVLDGVDFGNRENSPPDIGYFRSDLLLPTVETDDGVDDGIVQLRVGEISDAQDGLLGVGFWRESNGTPGLQTRGADQDAYISFKSFKRGREFKTWAPTVGLDANTFYTRVYDVFGFMRQSQVTVLPSGLEPPAQPVGLTSTVVNATTVQLNWVDASDNEEGFYLQTSNEPFLTELEAVDRQLSGLPLPRSWNVFLPAGTTSYTLTGLQPGQEVYARVRAFNPAGASSYAISDRAITRSENEVIIDNENTPRAGVNLLGDWQTRNDSRGFIGRSFVSSSTGEAVFNPRIPVEGRYLVFAKYPEGATATSVPVDITDKLGTTRITLDQTRQVGGWVLLGTHEFKQGRFGSIVFNADEANGTVFVDAVRVQPAFA